MKKTSFYSALIQELENIYARLVLNVLHIRMDRYHKQAHQSTKSYSTDIKSPLLSCISTLSDKAQINSEMSSAIEQSMLASDNSSTVIHDHYPAAEVLVVSTENVGELSKYFKARGNGSGLHPGVETKLEQSTWEHIHAAVRYARQGNTSSAKMHVNIASSACQELAHYMHEEQYRQFVVEIEQHLENVVQDMQGETSGLI